VLVGAFLLFLLHPNEGGVVLQTPDGVSLAALIPESARTPDGAKPAVPPETI
jgi:hypothetical protein